MEKLRELAARLKEQKFSTYSVCRRCGVRFRCPSYAQPRSYMCREYRKIYQSYIERQGIRNAEKDAAVKAS